MTQLVCSTVSPLSSISRVRAWWLRWYGPTWLVLATILGGWSWLTMVGGEWPAWQLMLVGGPLLCWYGSLQHELIHGHLLPGSRWNDRLASAPLDLWLPYARYRDTHLVHHATLHLADPLADPESFYVMPGCWAGLGSLRRGLLWVNNTLAGRMLIGPWLQVGGFYLDEWRALCQGDRTRWRVWAWHGLGVALVIGWLLAWDFSPLRYALLVVWPATGLLLLRSFHEHRPADSLAAASVVMEAAWPWRWLFLNNNYHVLHHRSPELPWYRLHDRYRRERDALLTANRGFYFSGYGEWFRRYAWWPRDHPCFPVGEVAADSASGISTSDHGGHHEHGAITASGEPGNHWRPESGAGRELAGYSGGTGGRGPEPAPR